MAMVFNTFLAALQRKFGDTSDAFTNLAYDFLDDRLEQMDSEEDFRDLQERFTQVITPSDYTFSLSAVSVNYESDSLISLKADSESKGLKYMSLIRFQNESVTDQTGTPEYYIPLNIDSVQVYPIPTKSYTLTGFIAKNHPAITLTSDSILYSNNKIKALKFGVTADIYEDRGDDRYSLYEQKYREQLQECRTKSKSRLQRRNQRLEQGI